MTLEQYRPSDTTPRRRYHVRENMQRRVIHKVGGRVITQQGLQNEANINSILERWRSGAVIPMNQRAPQYGDFSNVDDYHTEMTRVGQAQEEFARLPAAVRKEVENDVGQFLEMTADPDGLKKLIELGLPGELAPPGVVAPARGGSAPEEPVEDDPPPE